MQQVISWLSDLPGGIIAGLGTLLVIWVANYIRRRYHDKSFRAFFGSDIAQGQEAYLVYTSFKLNPHKVKVVDNEEKHLYTKRLEGKEGIPELIQRAIFSIDAPISGAEMRAVKHLSEAIGGHPGVSLTLIEDYDDKIWGQHNLSFITCGSDSSNKKSFDALEANEFLEFLQLSDKLVVIASKRSNSHFPKQVDRNYDYGMIVKVSPAQFPLRTWFVCAGLGEWGTSGAAYFLANKWKSIHSQAGEGSFGAVVKVTPYEDQTAQLIYYDDPELEKPITDPKWG